MGKKITQYPNNVSTNPDNLSLLDLSEKTGASTFESRKWNLTAFKAWVNSWVVAGTVAWNDITGKPNVVDTTGGTANYVAKFTDTDTIEESQIQDNGSNIGIGVNPFSPAKVCINGGGFTNALLVFAGANGKFGVRGSSQTDGLDTNTGIMGEAYNQQGIAIGVSGYVSGGTQAIGIKSEATSGTLKYCFQGLDGTQGEGKFLKSVTSDGKANWDYLPTEIQLAVSDETTALTAGTGKITFRMPYAMTVTEVRASLAVAGATSGLTTIDINENGVSILSTKLTIDLTEKTSTTATTPAVISDTALADDAEITVDIDAISGGATEKGLKVLIKGYRIS